MRRAEYMYSTCLFRMKHLDKTKKGRLASHLRKTPLRHVSLTHIHMYTTPGCPYGRAKDILLEVQILRADAEKSLQVLNIRLQFLEAHPSSSVWLALSIATENPHPNASDTFLLASNFQSVVSENVILP
jgi:hypothetical protein